MDQIQQVRKEVLINVDSFKKTAPEAASSEAENARLRTNHTLKPEVIKTSIARIPAVEDLVAPDIDKLNEISKVTKKGADLQTLETGIQAQVQSKILDKEELPNIYPNTPSSDLPDSLRELDNENAFLARLLCRLVSFLPTEDPDMEDIEETIDEALGIVKQ